MSFASEKTSYFHHIFSLFSFLSYYSNSIFLGLCLYFSFPFMFCLFLLCLVEHFFIFQASCAVLDFCFHVFNFWELFFGLWMFFLFLNSTPFLFHECSIFCTASLRLLVLLVFKSSSYTDSVSANCFSFCLFLFNFIFHAWGISQLSGKSWTVWSFMRGELYQLGPNSNKRFIQIWTISGGLIYKMAVYEGRV